jgi:hypothetical protein
MRRMSGWRRVCAFYFVLTLVYSWPILVAISARLPSDIADPGLNAWIMWWNSQAIPLTERWWNAPMFYPAPGAFALSETLLGVAPLTVPMHWLGIDAVTVYNVVFILSIFGAAIAGHALAYRLTGRHDAAAIAGAAFGFSPYRVAQTPHLQTELALFMPLCLLCLHRYVEISRPRYLALAALCFTINGLMSGYFLLFFPVLVALWLLWHARHVRTVAIVATTLLIAYLPLSPLLLGYHRYQSDLGLSRGIEEIEAFSADATSIWAASPLTSFARLWTIHPRAEGELYPGVMVLGLVIVASSLALRSVKAAHTRQRRISQALLIAGCLMMVVAVVCMTIGGTQFHLLGLRFSLTRPYKLITVSLWCFLLAALSSAAFVRAWKSRSTFCFYTLAAGVMFLFALGPVGRVAGQRFLYKAPYSLLLYLPGGSGLRVPARFAMLFVLCLSQAAALAFARMAPRQRSQWLAVAVTAIIVLDGWVVLPMAAVPVLRDLVGLDPRAVVIELPVVDEYAAGAALLRQTKHRHPIGNGYSGYAPPHHVIFETGLRDQDASVIAAFQQLGPVAVFVRKDRPPQMTSRLLEDMPRAQRIVTGSEGDVYDLPQVEPAPRPVGSALPIQSIRANGVIVNAAVFQDGDPATRWEAPAHLGREPHLSVTLAAKAAIDAIELGLGPYRLDYPRRLRVEIAADSEPPHRVWEGRTAGLSMLAVLRDYRSPTLAIPVPPGSVAQQIVLTLTEEDKVFSWSVADLRIIGTLFQ